MFIDINYDVTCVVLLPREHRPVCAGAVRYVVPLTDSLQFPADRSALQ